MTPRQRDKDRGYFDPDDRQGIEMMAAAEGLYLGQRKFRAATGATMESLSYDLPMPVSPRPAWTSIDERDPASAPPSEAYDRRNGLGRHWGKPDPAEGPRLERLGELAQALEDAGFEREVAVVMAPVALLFIMAAERKAG